MFIFLPPSETKRRPVRAAAADLDRLLLPQLAPARQQIAEAVAAASALPDAAERFGVSEKLMEAVRANAEALSSPAAPAHKVYEGVLYEALDYGSLSAAAKRRASSVVVFSALFGPVRLTDRIPAYRASAGTKIPGLEEITGAQQSSAPQTASRKTQKPLALSAAWARILKESAAQEPLPWDGELIIDCRSSGYASMRPAREASTLPVEVLQRTATGLKTISHSAKRARGLAARILLEQPAAALKTPQQAADVLHRVGEQAHGWSVSLSEADQTGSSLRIVLPASPR